MVSYIKLKKSFFDIHYQLPCYKFDNSSIVRGGNGGNFRFQMDILAAVK
jgi:hypothetical protein